MATKENDLSPDHFKWIVEGRSANQKSTLDLYRLIHDYHFVLINNPVLHSATVELTGVAFSLWRAVFLSDTTEENDQTLDDVKKFLVSLISDNTVLYNTDKSARNWSFQYYLDNAVNRLDKLSKEPLQLVRTSDFYIVESHKPEWIRAQHILEEAIGRFEKALRGFAGPPSS